MARRATKLGLSVAAAGAATYAAERWTVARWASGPDEYRHEPRTLTGTTRYVASADGTKLHVIEAGEGPTAVLAHGFTATAHHWAPVASRLVERGLRVVVFDQRGHGRSTAINGRFGPSQLADDLAAVIAATAPDGAVVAGHSMGGIGIQAMLAHHPTTTDRLHGMVLIATLSRPVSVPLGRLMSRLGGTALA
ncbi:MAG: alpha/beta fold hydrolase, partial [Acidimicrobiia bacterium]|nr:alpha/beta fold hydrolase [Acidimicrobiia bacterium]